MSIGSVSIPPLFVPAQTTKPAAPQASAAPAATPVDSDGDHDGCSGKVAASVTRNITA
jgi:hypothetical protein